MYVAYLGSNAHGVLLDDLRNLRMNPLGTHSCTYLIEYCW